MGLVLEFLGEVYSPSPDVPFVVGREADLSIDDNPFLHRRFLAVTHHQGLWWLANVGAQLTATISDADGALQAWLAPGASLPIVFGRTRVWFTAGSTTYELDLVLSDPPFEGVSVGESGEGSLTIGRTELTPDQKLLVVALCENALRRGERGATAVPPSARAAERLGWGITRFNRKLDNVCFKLAEAGVRGLHGGPGRLAVLRKARLVEYALAARLVTPADLDLLPPG